MNYYYINPNYSLEKQGGRVIIYEDMKDNYSFLPFFPQFDSIVHPLHAQILTFFQGITDIENAIDHAAAYFNVSSQKIKDFILPLIENTSKLDVFFKDTVLTFPECTIIKLPYKDDNILTYNVEEFRVEKIDLTRKRFEILRQVNLLPTFKCYTNCKYCFEDRKNENAINILPIEKIKEIIWDAKTLGVKKLEVMGGEVFCYPQWEEMYDELKKAGYLSLISTKYPLTSEMVNKVKQLGVPRLQISLDTLIPQHISDILRVNSKYIEKIINTINLCDEAGINLNIHTILTKYNCHLEDMMSLFDFISSKVNIIEWRVDMVYASYFSEFKYSDLYPDSHQLKNVIKELTELNKKYPKLIVPSFQNKDEELNYPQKMQKFLLSSVRCPANHSQMIILPDGKVTVCDKTYWIPEFIIGDIKTQTIEEIWKSKRALEVANLKYNSRPQSKCYQCEEIDICHEHSCTCYMNVIAAYGPNNYDFPDPSCPRAPQSF